MDEFANMIKASDYSLQLIDGTLERFSVFLNGS